MEAPSRLQRLAPYAPLAFVGGVLIHIVALIRMGHPWPGGMMADANVYLELASRVWMEGQFGTKVSINYPPAYPFVISPTFAFETNAGRFAALYTWHGLIWAAASLTLLPALRDGLGRTRAWVALGLVQLVGGTTLHAIGAQTELLFSAELLAATGVAYMAWKRPAVWRFALLGALCGLAISTRRTALVLPVALFLLFAADVISARRDSTPFPWRVAVGMGVGLAIGLLPEYLVQLSIGTIQPYGGSPASSHLGAAPKAFTSPSALFLAVQVVGRHIAWATVTTFGAPIILLLLIVRRRSEVPRPLARAGGFALLSVAGLICMASLHILRFRYSSRPGGWDLYPRYVDPPEAALIVMGLLAAAWLVGAEKWSPRARLRAAAPYAAAVALMTALAGPMFKSKGGRFPSDGRLELMGLAWLGGLVFLIVMLLGLAAWLMWWWKGRQGGLAALALAVGVTILLAGHSFYPRLTTTPSDPAPLVLKSKWLQNDAVDAIAVVVYKTGFDSRGYYKVAFRSNHRVTWMTHDQVPAWIAEHPDGVVLVRRRDLKKKRGPRPQLEKLAVVGKWIVMQTSEAAIRAGHLSPDGEPANP